MRPAISLEGPLLVCDRIDGKLSDFIERNRRVVHKSKGLLLCHIEEPPPASLSSIVTGLELHRYLDRFYLLVPANDGGRRQKLLDEFFSFIARDYESLIDRDRNIDNIRNLLKFVNPYVPVPGEATIIDYGCGTGLSYIVAKEFRLNLIGLDRCPAMRAIASHRGMKVWNPGDLARQPSNSIDASLASYVFHLLPNTKELELLWARIKPGGILVANFHKDVGEDLVAHCLEPKGCSTVKLLPPHGSERHGSYFAFLKP